MEFVRAKSVKEFLLKVAQLNPQTNEVHLNLWCTGMGGWTPELFRNAKARLSTNLKIFSLTLVDTNLTKKLIDLFNEVNIRSLNFTRVIAHLDDTKFTEFLMRVSSSFEISQCTQAFTERVLSIIPRAYIGKVNIETIPGRRHIDISYSIQRQIFSIHPGIVELRLFGSHGSMNIENEFKFLKQCHFLQHRLKLSGRCRLEAFNSIADDYYLSSLEGNLNLLPRIFPLPNVSLYIPKVWVRVSREEHKALISAAFKHGKCTEFYRLLPYFHWETAAKSSERYDEYMFESLYNVKH